MHTVTCIASHDVTMCAEICTVLSLFLVTSSPSSPLEMKSIVHNTSNGSLRVETDTPKPDLRQGDVMIKVEAAGVNRLDLMQAHGQYPPPPGESEILGVEVAGTVEELSLLAGEKSGLKQGDKVMALVGGGGYAEFCRAPYQMVMRVPEGMLSTNAAGIPEVFLTAFQALVWNAHMKDGETVLIHAGASGVGLAAIQLSKVLFKDVKVIATAGSEEKMIVCKYYGADLTINYKTEDFAAEVLAATGDKGADVILDFVGASYWEKHVQCVAVDGRVVHLGLLGGAVTGPVNLGALLKKRVTHIFTTLRSRSIEYRTQLVQEFTSQVLPHFSNSSLKVTVDTVFPLEQAAKAHARMSTNMNIGKIIITL